MIEQINILLFSKNETNIDLAIELLKSQNIEYPSDKILDYLHCKVNYIIKVGVRLLFESNCKDLKKIVSYVERYITLKQFYYSCYTKYVKVETYYEYFNNSYYNPPCYTPPRKSFPRGDVMEYVNILITSSNKLITQIGINLRNNMLGGVFI